MRTSRQRAAAGLAVCLAGVLASADQTTEPSTSPTAPQLIAETLSTEPLTPQWQARLGELVRTNALSPLVAGRMYAALSVAQYRAIVAVDTGVGVDGRSRFEAERGAVSGASAVVLGFLFPGATSALEGQVATDATSGKGKTDPSFTRGLAIGRAAGEAMIAHLQTDGSSLPFSGTIPAGPGFWTPAPGVPPGGANLGGVTPYLVNSTSQFRSAPPPAFGSPAFEADLDEVLSISQHRTAEQTASALFWATGTSSPPLGFWAEKAGEYIEAAGLDERAAAQVFGLMHAAQFDAQLTCFGTKYHYFVIRPSQAEPAITPVTPLPNYPAYPAGHACVSSAAAHVLAHVFPDRAAELEKLVTEAGLSRVYAGVHYRFDVEAAWILGRAVAGWAISHEGRLR